MHLVEMITRLLCSSCDFHQPCGLSQFVFEPTQSSLLFLMVSSSYVALNMVDSGGIGQLKRFISQSLDSSINTCDVIKPVGLHFCLLDKIFVGTNQRFIQCPIHFLLQDHGTSDTLRCRPVWTENSHRSHVDRKAKVGVKKHSVVRLDDFSVVVPHEPAVDGYIFFIRSYSVVKKDVDLGAYGRWILD